MPTGTRGSGHYVTAGNDQADRQRGEAETDQYVATGRRGTGPTGGTRCSTSGMAARGIPPTFNPTRPIIRIMLGPAMRHQKSEAGRNHKTGGCSGEPTEYVLQRRDMGVAEV